MIITVTLNPALDISYTTDELVIHGSHRVRTVTERAGGKGVNVASVLNDLGFDAICTGLLGGSIGRQVAADLDARGMAHDFISCQGNSRRTVNVTSRAHGDATIFNEPGPVMTTGEWAAMRDRLTTLVSDVGARVVVLSGSLPHGLPDDAYAQLVDLVQATGALTIVDADGEPLRRAIAGAPSVIKPNLAELAAATGGHDGILGAMALQRLGARDVVISAGADGLLAFTHDGERYRARLRRRLGGNPTGAGDAVVAALAAGLAAGSDWPTMLTDAVSWSAAAVLQPVAGQVDRQDVARLAPDVQMETT